jgi:phenylpropionate dioxygenase-like ring-hydroxylating dioxygenase large terminal subunit
MIMAAKDGHTRRENVHTQPLRPFRVFNNPEVVTESWYPVCASKDLPKGKAKSFKITFQRIVVFRGEDGKVRALDAFCSHMGADLGNGRVRGNEIECYFHQWRYDERGCLTQARGVNKKPVLQQLNRAYAVEEKYGFVWVYAGEKPTHNVPEPPGLEGEELVSWHVTGPLLHAHHHVMMAGGIDLLHFASVHGIDAAFEHEVFERSQHVADWHVRGQFPETGWRSKLARFALGNSFGYDARFAGGSVCTLTYGPEQRARGTGRPLPPLHMLWGCVAEESGHSRVHIFIISRRRPGRFGWLQSQGLLALTVALLALLQDDDVKAFPHMRFNPKTLVAEDSSVARLIRFIESLPTSDWSRVSKTVAAGAFSSATNGSHTNDEGPGEVRP